MTLDITCLPTLPIIMSVSNCKRKEWWMRVFAIAEGESARLNTPLIVDVAASGFVVEECGKKNFVAIGGFEERYWQSMWLRVEIGT